MIAASFFRDIKVVSAKFVNDLKVSLCMSMNACAYLHVDICLYMYILSLSDSHFSVSQSFTTMYTHFNLWLHLHYLFSACYFIFLFERLTLHTLSLFSSDVRWCRHISMGLSARQRVIVLRIEEGLSQWRVSMTKRVMTTQERCWRLHLSLVLPLPPSPSLLCS